MYLSEQTGRRCIPVARKALRGSARTYSAKQKNTYLPRVSTARSANS